MTSSNTPAREKPWLLRLPQPEGRETNTTDASETLPPDTFGLSLSGGGIRSASFCLGVLQVLAKNDWLRHVDFISTVSGGGYVGSFLGRAFDTQADRSAPPGEAHDRVAAALGDSRSHEVTWLRRHANYLTPTGTGDSLFNFAAFWRNFLSLHLALAVVLVGLFGAVNALHYSSLTDRFWPLLSWLTPLTDGAAPPFGSPWAGAAELVLWLAVVPLIFAYWLASQERHEDFVWQVLAAVTLLAIGLLLATVSPVSLAVLAAAVFWALLAWRKIREEEGLGSPRSRFRCVLARNALTHRLARFVSLGLALVGLWGVDVAGRWLVQADGDFFDSAWQWFGGVGAGLLAFVPVLRVVAGFFATRDAEDAPAAPSLLRGSLTPSVVILVFGALPPLAAVSMLSHATFDLGCAWWRGAAVTAIALLIAWLLGRRECIQFVNRSGHLIIYAARLSRTFQGAVNPVRRRHPEGRDVTRVVSGDDVPFDEYRPHLAGGPLHLINCAVNETMDVASERGQVDRQAENLAVGPAGVSVSTRWHGLWKERGGHRLGPAIEPVHAGAGPNPFVSVSGRPIIPERLNLRVWTAISGAALSPGIGRHTSFGYSLLLTLANLRLGYWWRSGLTAAERKYVPPRSGLLSRLQDGAFAFFGAQWLVLCELGAKFGGPWHPYWYLSDGGNFEISGAYELIRRRMPFVVIIDANQDRMQRGSLIAELTRIVRIDFGAEIEEADTPSEAPESVRDHLGKLTDLLGEGDCPPTKHAALLKVRYPTPTDSSAAGAWNGRAQTWVLYLKASVTGDESADLLNYQALHPNFPNESTLDQFFDEPQFESYRKLGEHIGERVLADISGNQTSSA